MQMAALRRIGIGGGILATMPASSCNAAFWPGLTGGMDARIAAA
jgi:glutaminase